MFYCAGCGEVLPPGSRAYACSGACRKSVWRSSHQVEYRRYEAARAVKRHGLSSPFAALYGVVGFAWGQGYAR